MTPPPKHPDALSYWADVHPRLKKFIENKRNTVMEECILHTLAVYSYVQEHLTYEATRNKDVLQKTGILLVLMQDALRGLFGAQCELSPVASACLTRNILETRCNLLFIYTSQEPAKWADRFHRFIGVEKMLHDQHRPEGALSMLSAGEREGILRLSPEWFDEDGRVRVPHWTAEKQWKSLKALAKQVGLQAEYHQLYSVGSKFMHGSPLLVNMYSQGGSIGAVTNPEICASLSSLATSLAMKMMKETAEFYGAPTFDHDRTEWQKKWLRAADLQRPQK